MTHSISNLKNPFEPFDADLMAAFERNISTALAEDVGTGDLTGLLVPDQQLVQAQVIVREEAVLCGAPWFDAVMERLDARIKIVWMAEEGALMLPNSLVCKITAPARALLTAERSALNFLQLLSGVAMATRDYVRIIEGTAAAILDTRKTLPGLRLAQKYAVRVGGGQNQRLALYDGILIKENHIAAAGGIEAAMQAAHALQADVSIQIEVETLDQLKLALKAGATSILLDNFTTDMMRDAVNLNAGRALLEASGGVDKSSVRAIAETGVDRISIGSLTKDIKAIDYSLRII
ncbi:carboxylating nicotinate-nucleotide diphosphorylase [Undibacterium sp. RTI2.1]|uniref:carboxylating nicotinate-nucleotide diphosphorylase n=1 Tax=unclassified Undibacterium TaxID=2630295 RepID=UPI002AB41CB8|nr:MULTISPECIES: carboxylating nicotinate-nucleotide diphosphorylase [unclassified Undibacterium]MDY7537712.1 carboxylating nicotinate-nucleotide diphosphorylase [Undibacterium sp. 5I1]MEB0029313.1 carboxylating nicotinate-nucleotide diphosphorylase [Undibacterium sp. RTI2.1]MEB0115621.1 carboxylating nicotinate-nucleotide diphosphorylase [Undibacterium sp. RTI2.2]MEB0230204.1 carboxylating nicotinate-nucleotide diphosphorylase [Undibacterium sp. 10I3]MEB0256449.1 carboxylating nicotinate-nucl